MEPPNKFISDWTHVVLELNNLQINSYILSKKKILFLEDHVNYQRKISLSANVFSNAK